jgi:hypothetical protein
MVEQFVPPRKQIHAAIRLDCDSAITVEFDFFCGDERYVALTLISEPAASDFADSTT